MLTNLDDRWFALACALSLIGCDGLLGHPFDNLYIKPAVGTGGTTDGGEPDATASGGNVSAGGANASAGSGSIRVRGGFVSASVDRTANGYRLKGKLSWQAASGAKHNAQIVVKGSFE